MLWNGCKKSRRADIEDIETPQEFDLVRPYVMFLFLKDRMAMVNEDLVILYIHIVISMD